MITAAMVGPIHGPACENKQYNSITLTRLGEVVRWSLRVFHQCVNDMKDIGVVNALRYRIPNHVK